MKLSSEVKIGIISIVTITVLIWGINYLKGKNILDSNLTLYAFFSDAHGLEPSADLYMNGFKIGLVDDVKFTPSTDPPIKVVLRVEKSYKIPDNSVAELFSSDLLGTKSIRIIPFGSNDFLKNQDTINSHYVPDMLSSLQEEIYPVLNNLNNLGLTLDSAGHHLNNLISSGKIDQIMDQVEDATENISNSLGNGGALNESLENIRLITRSIQEKSESIASILDNLNGISNSINTLAIDSLFNSLTLVTYQLNTMLKQVNSGSGSMGQLIYNDSLYNNLETLTLDLDLLIKDLHENPNDYVQISVFGKSKK